MNSYTLTLYTIASGLCFCLSLVLLVFAQIRRTSLLVNASAKGLVTLAMGFLGAGIGPLMPLWFTVIGMNAVLLSSGLFFYSGIRAFVTQQVPRFDRVGAALVLLAMPFLVYWGFVDPDGQRRAVVFSLTVALVHGRIAWLLVLHFRHTAFRAALVFVTVTFVVLAVWMLARSGVLLLAPPLAPEVKSANPTTWPTVFAFNVLISLFAASLLAAEVQAQQQRLQDAAEGEVVRGNLQLLWGIVAVVLFAILSETGIAYLVLYQREQQQLKDQNSQSNQALVAQAQQLMGQADLTLRATRDLAQKGYPIPALEQFVGALHVPQPVFDDVYLMAADGQIVLPRAERGKVPQGERGESFLFHQSQPLDLLHVSPLSVSPATGELQFHLSRRVNDAQGRFAGVVRVSLDLSVLTQYYAQWIRSDDGVAALLGDDDHRIRARLPLPDHTVLLEPVASPLWALHRSESGSFTATSMLDGFDRQYVYRRLQGVPLVMVTGFSAADVHRNALQSLKPIALGAVLAIAVVLAMAFMLGAALRRRDEQDRFLSMISHELRTPLSVIRMVAGAMPEATQGRVVRAVNDMNTIIDSALQTDRLRHGSLRAQVSDCDVGEVMHAAWQQLAEPGRVSFEQGPPLLGQTDAQLLQVVLRNLLDNALKYSAPDSTVQVQVQPAQHQRKAGVRITVSNRVGAVGAPDAKQVFRKFYRAPAARGKTGSGLGLHIAEGLVRLLGGYLKYSSSGNTVQFVLWIPL